jgi:hypothetical protein
MEKRSRRRTRDLVTQAASQGLSQNEIGCARISMMARSTNAPCKGRIQMRKTNPLHLFRFGLQRTAGPYSWVKLKRTQCEQMPSGLLLKAYIAQCSRHVSKVPTGLGEVKRSPCGFSAISPSVITHLSLLPCQPNRERLTIFIKKARALVIQTRRRQGRTTSC